MMECLRRRQAAGSVAGMSYAALEVELREGRVIPRGPEPLPQSGSGLLVILSSTNTPCEASGWQRAVADIRRRQQARDYAPRDATEVGAQLHEERTSWD